MKTKQRHSGQSLVEFALIIPIAFFLITGFFDLGRAVFNYSSLTNAVRQATRFAIVQTNTYLTRELNNTNPSPNLQDKVMDYAFGMTLIRDKIIVTFAPKDAKGFTTVSIQATYLYQPITPGIKALLGTEGISIRASSKMYVTPGSR